LRRPGRRPRRTDRSRDGRRGSGGGEVEHGRGDRGVRQHEQGRAPGGELRGRRRQGGESPEAQVTVLQRMVLKSPPPLSQLDKGSNPRLAWGFFWKTQQ